VTGLVEDTEYVFRFSGESEAGIGEVIYITARTAPTHAALSRAPSHLKSLPFLLLLLFSFSWLHS
jgi:hypothetical protein